MGGNVLIQGKLDTDRTKVQEVYVDSEGKILTSLGNSADLAWPATWQLDLTSLAGTADDDVLYTSPDVSEYNYHVIENESGVLCDVFVSVDGTNFSTAAASVELVDDVTTGGGIKVISIADNKVGILRGKFKKIRIDQAAAGTPSAGTIRGFHGVE